MNDVYYDGTELLTKYALFKMCIGGRGIGKTYFFKKFVIDKAIKSKGKETFIYLRRYKAEMLGKDMEKFCAQVQQEFPNIEFTYSKGFFYANKIRIGEAISLSTAVTKKSVNYDSVKYIVFDEFIIDKSCYHYLQEEVTNFLDFYETVARTKDVQVFMLSNAITQNNPYFDYFGVRIDDTKEFQKTNTKECIVQFVNSDKFINYKLQTRFGQMISKTEYGAYAINNNFRLDSDKFIEQRDKNSNYFFTLKIGNNEYGVWVAWQSGKLYVSNKVDKTYKIEFCLAFEDHTRNSILIEASKRSIYLRTLKKAFETGTIYFDDVKIKKNCYDLYKIL